MAEVVVVLGYPYPTMVKGVPRYLKGEFPLATERKIFGVLSCSRQYTKDSPALQEASVKDVGSSVNIALHQGFAENLAPRNKTQIR